MNVVIDVGAALWAAGESPTPYIGVRDEYRTTFGRQHLTLWSPPFSSTFEGWAHELPGHDGFMVTLDYSRGRIRVECEAPRDDDNWMRVDDAIREAVTAHLRAKED